MPDDDKALAPAKVGKPKGPRPESYYTERGLASPKAQKILAKAVKLRFVDQLSYEDIGAIVGLPNRDVQRMLAPFKPMLDDPAGVKAYKANEPEIMDGLRMLMTSGMYTILTNPDRIAKMDLSRLTYGFGIMYDKARLERGESTSNVKTLSDLVRSAHATEVPAEAEVVEETPECDIKPSSPQSS
jgi:hypothetical protein